ncbi:hypothetical protein ACNTMW_09330 [Planosporangium sp. 12N6]|uniref:hypothetical protein n=1 Tax=Planosporangium spinosum TaxID=3402278 RepID=UPI003CE67419
MAREQVVGIDDLLGTPAEDESRPARPEPAPTVASSLFWSTAVAALLSAAAYLVLRPVGLRVPYILLWAGFFALLALRRAVRVVRPPRWVVGARPEPPGTVRIDPTRVADGMQLALARWETRLSWSDRERQRFLAEVRPRLAEIAEERLRQRHGVTRAADPRRAREIMGERLWAFLFDPPGRAPNPRQLAAVVDDMEKL